MPTFIVDSITIDPEEFVEACTPNQIGEIVNILSNDFNDDIKDSIHLSPDEFLDKSSHFELEDTFSMLKENYGMKDDDDPRSDGQRIFNNHLNQLKASWLAVTKEDADIITILAKKYGAY
jgi:hypothetical protein